MIEQVAQRTSKDRKQILLYIHIPFCVHRCRFCTACTSIDSNEAKDAYLQALKAEMDVSLSMLSEYMLPAVYIGGGSPSVMRGSDVAKLILRFLEDLKVDPHAEVSIELMPQTVGTPLLTGLSRGRINRWSLSMQSTDSSELRTLDCGFSFRDVRNAALFLSKFHLHNLNVDLMVGIPGQTPTTFRRTLNFMMGIGVRHVSLYDFPGLGDADPESLPALPGEQVITEMREYAEAFLPGQGLRQYTKFHFARQGAESKYFFNRYSGMEFVGLGLGARSFIDGFVYTNTTDLDYYLTNSADFEKITTDVVELSDKQVSEYRIAMKQNLLVQQERQRGQSLF
jgi:oxygen-independent coproporphyrinogen-3 oxidase